MTEAPRMILGVLLVLGLTTRHASANIAFEVYEVGRPDDAEAPVGAFLHELAKHGYTAEPRDVMDHLGNQVTHPAIANPKLTARQLLVELGAAHAKWTRAPDFRILAPALAELVAEAFDNRVVRGRHVVTIERDECQTETRTVEAVEGKTAEVMVKLRRLEPLGPDLSASNATSSIRRARCRSRWSQPDPPLSLAAQSRSRSTRRTS